MDACPPIPDARRAHMLEGRRRTGRCRAVTGAERCAPLTDAQAVSQILGVVANLAARVERRIEGASAAPLRFHRPHHHVPNCGRPRVGSADAGLCQTKQACPAAASRGARARGRGVDWDHGGAGRSLAIRSSSPISVSSSSGAVRFFRVVVTERCAAFMPVRNWPST